MTTSTVRMQDDVDGYINSEWKSNNPIPDIYPRYTNFTALSENLEKQKIEICENKENVIINNLIFTKDNQVNKLIIILKN